MMNPGSSQQLLIYMSIDPQGMAQWNKSHGAHAGLTQHSAAILSYRVYVTHNLQGIPTYIPANIICLAQVNHS